jgi:hypothetical protein
MSDQSQFYNPQPDRMALSGSGFILPRLTTTQRLALTVGANDTGLEVYDTTAGSLYLWNGTAWSAVGGGGGMQRILATTITYTGTPGARANQITGTGVGVLPDPATVLPGGTLQSVQYWVTTAVDYQLTTAYQTVGVVNDARVPFYFTVGGIEYIGTRSISITASSTFQNTGLVNNANWPRLLETFTLPATGSTPSFTLRVGEPNYYLETGTTVVAQDFIVTNLNLDATVQVYYVFS